MSERAHALRQPLRRHTVDRLFRSCINVQQINIVRVIERPREVVHQVHCARITMRLKNCMQARKMAVPGSGERRANLRRMMAVIVEYSDAFFLASLLKPPVDTGKQVQSFTYDIGRDFKLESHRHGGSRVQNVVSAWDAEMKLTEIFVFIPESKTACKMSARRRCNHEVRLRADSIRNHPAADS